MTDTEFKIQLHNKLCSIAELTLHNYNPCRILDGKCIGGENIVCCTGTRFNRKDTRRCYFLSENGCTAPNIECRVYLCKTAKEKYPECALVLQQLENIARQFHLGF